MVHTPEGEVYFAGDTGLGPHFNQIRKRYGPMRLSLILIGAYKPEWFMKRVHTSPPEGLIAHKLLESEYSVGIHFGTFKLADDSQYEPHVDLAQAREQ